MELVVLYRYDGHIHWKVNGWVLYTFGPTVMGS